MGKGMEKRWRELLREWRSMETRQVAEEETEGYGRGGKVSGRWRGQLRRCRKKVGRLRDIGRRRTLERIEGYDRRGRELERERRTGKREQRAGKEI